MLEQGATIALRCPYRRPCWAKAAIRWTTRPSRCWFTAGANPWVRARLWWSDGAFFAGDVCVLPEARGQGYGDLLVRLLLYKAVSHNAAGIRLMCPRAAAAFFARYGFAPAEGGDPAADTVEMRLRAGDICLRCKHDPS
jgi:GNAT superfamily N-acetyltransferase